MDVELVLLVGAALVGIVVGILHLVGYVPPRYRSMLAGIQENTAEAIAERLKEVLVTTLGDQTPDEDVSQGLRTLSELPRILQELPIKIGIETEAALNRVAVTQKAEMIAEAQAAVASAGMSVVRGVRTIKDMDRQADALIGKAILSGGQGLLMALRTIAPGFADQIEEMLEANPEGAMQLWEIIQGRPAFQKYVAPRLAAILGAKPGPTDTGNPFLGELGR